MAQQRTTPDPSGPAIGIITIGQSPRPDMVPEMRPHWRQVAVVEAGALDGLDDGRLQTMAAAVPTAEPDEEILTSRLRDGGSLTFTRRDVLPLVQQRIAELEAAGVVANLLVCTGSFPPLRHERPLHTAESLLVPGVGALAAGAPIGVVCPLPAQREGSVAKFAGVAPRVETADADPYGADQSAFTAAAQELTAAGSELLVLDCMGYTEQHRQWIAAASQVPVVLARSVVARLFGEVVAGLSRGEEAA